MARSRISINGSCTALAIDCQLPVSLRDVALPSRLIVVKTTDVTFLLMIIVRVSQLGWFVCVLFLDL